MIFLNKNFFFNRLKPTIFKKKVFYDFVQMEFQKGKTITNEKESLQHLFFIKEGEIELTAEISLVELNRLIYTLVFETRCFPDPENFLDSEIEVMTNDSQVTKKRNFRVNFL